MKSRVMRTVNDSTPAARELYLDLLVRILLNTIYQDPAINPGVRPMTVEPFNPKTRAIGKDWPTQAHTMVGQARLENLRNLSQQVLDDGIVGDFIETGVWRGGCCILMRGVLAANQIHDRKVYVADSFAGLPAPNEELYPGDTGWNLHVFKELAVSLETVKDNFSRYGLLDEQVVFVEGMFSDTLPSLSAGPFALLRLDGDLYESTIVALNSLYPKLSQGGVVIIDDRALAPCRRAVIDFRDRHGITAPMQEVDWTGSWWRKE
jgi:O-methyltransferase/8-demethyl-8-(2,3-dimethoxy-alpha-L-rhamnosyl)tetracenomycin-C 4'-O-methyltransferase